MNGDDFEAKRLEMIADYEDDKMVEMLGKFDTDLKKFRVINKESGEEVTPSSLFDVDGDFALLSNGLLVIIGRGRVFVGFSEEGMKKYRIEWLN
ncbi:hypothetical protein [Methanobrevibacter sp. DSM 116169]|uniref:hypothetical protein n=1 Tax=Methanobrevibacter sp. DSM 116169 TaxID=3242727 RepID=UPI0038FC262D